MDKELKARLDAQDEKLSAIYTSVEATRKYFLWTMIITIALFVLPLIGLVVAIPAFLGAVTTDIGALGL